MLATEDKDYCKLQRVAATSITGDDIHSVFQRFEVLYPLYNRLYNLVPAALTAIGKTPPSKLQDNNKATSVVVQYLGGKQILNHLAAHNNNEDVDILTDILEHRIFNIKLQVDGTPHVDGNNKLAADIKSPYADVKATAILYFLYYVRCNIFHGQKHREDDQRLLLGASTRILQTVTDQLYDRLNTQTQV
jgi:hypothetical protein